MLIGGAFPLVSSSGGQNTQPSNLARGLGQNRYHALLVGIQVGQKFLQAEGGLPHIHVGELSMLCFW